MRIKPNRILKKLINNLKRSIISISMTDFWVLKDFIQFIQKKKVPDHHLMYNVSNFLLCAFLGKKKKSTT